MVTREPEFISTSERLESEQLIFGFERKALFLLFFPLYTVLQYEATMAVHIGLLLALFIFLFTTFMYLESSDSKVKPSNINPNSGVKTEAKVKRVTNLHQPYPQAERILFWIDRFGISLFFIMFLSFTETNIGTRRFAIAMAIFFFVSNFAYFHLFLFSEERYYKITGPKRKHVVGTSTQNFNSHASGSGSSLDLNIKKAKPVEVKKNEKVFSEYENLKASHVEELREAIEQCKGKYKMKLKDKECKLHEEYSKDIEEWENYVTLLEEEYSEETEKCKKEWKNYYQMKLNKKKNKRQEELKKVKDEHEENRQKWKEEYKKAMEEHKEDHRKWEEEKIRLVAELVAAKASSEHYRYLLQDGDYSFSN